MQSLIDSRALILSGFLALGVCTSCEKPATHSGASPQSTLPTEIAESDSAQWWIKRAESQAAVIKAPAGKDSGPSKKDFALASVADCKAAMNDFDGVYQAIELMTKASRNTFFQMYLYQQAKAGDVEGAIKAVDRNTDSISADKGRQRIISGLAATQRITESLELLKEIKDPDLRDWALGDIAEGQAQGGDMQEAQATINRIQNPESRKHNLLDAQKAFLKGQRERAALKRNDRTIPKNKSRIVTGLFFGQSILSDDLEAVAADVRNKKDMSDRVSTWIAIARAYWRRRDDESSSKFLNLATKALKDSARDTDPLTHKGHLLMIADLRLDLGDKMAADKIINDMLRIAQKAQNAGNRTSAIDALSRGLSFITRPLLINLLVRLGHTKMAISLARSDNESAMFSAGETYTALIYTLLDENQSELLVEAIESANTPWSRTNGYATIALWIHDQPKPLAPDIIKNLDAAARLPLVVPTPAP